MTNYKLGQLTKTLESNQAYIDGYIYNDRGERCFKVVGINETTIVPVADRPSWVIFTSIN